jgi:hypothetical protein
LTYGAALLWLFELHDRGDPRFRTAAARWHAMFTLTAKLPLGEADMVMRLLCGVGGANRLVVRRRLVECVDREGSLIGTWPLGTVSERASSEGARHRVA